MVEPEFKFEAARQTLAGTHAPQQQQQRNLSSGISEAISRQSSRGKEREGNRALAKLATFHQSKASVVATTNTVADLSDKAQFPVVKDCSLGK